MLDPRTDRLAVSPVSTDAEEAHTAERRQGLDRRRTSRSGRRAFDPREPKWFASARRKPDPERNR